MKKCAIFMTMIFGVFCVGRACDKNTRNYGGADTQDAV